MDASDGLVADDVQGDVPHPGEERLPSAE